MLKDCVDSLLSFIVIIFLTWALFRSNNHDTFGDKCKRSNAAKKHIKSPTVAFYSSDAWRKLRYRTIQTRGRRCQACRTDTPGIRYHVDHIKPRSHYPHLALLDSNVQVLCQTCNMGKGSEDETDWR